METARLAMTARATGDERNPPRDRPLSAATAVDQDLNPLQHLIHQRLRERGWSYGEVARRGGVARLTVYTLATTRNLARPPRPATLDGLAKASTCRSQPSAPQQPSPPGCTTTTRPRPSAGARATRNGSC